LLSVATNTTYANDQRSALNAIRHKNQIPIHGAAHFTAFYRSILDEELQQTSPGDRRTFTAFVLRSLQLKQ